MREYLFRGKVKYSEDNRLKNTNGKWVYGFLDKRNRGYSVGGWLVDAETISQYTGINDINGKKIFEGDILWADDLDIYVVVKFKNGKFEAVSENEGSCDLYFTITAWDTFVKGNIHDNPELAKEFFDKD